MVEHFNGLSPAELERLAMLSEEAAEICAIIGKIIRHGPRSFNPDRPELGDNMRQLQSEINDLCGVVHGMIEAGDWLELPDAHDMQKAWAKKLKYAHHQEEIPHDR